MATYERLVRNALKANGFAFLRKGKGDHEIWYNPITGKRVSVDSKIKSKYTANMIMKECNIKHKF